MAEDLRCGEICIKVMENYQQSFNGARCIISHLGSIIQFEEINPFTLRSKRPQPHASTRRPERKIVFASNRSVQRVHFKTGQHAKHLRETGRQSQTSMQRVDAGAVKE
jgi:hypothetical protein